MTARILVVDDIPANVKLLEARLLAEYFEVLTANSGREALEICEAGRVDVVLLDVMMPDMDGFEVCRRLKRDSSTAHIPVIMVTALDQTADRVRGLEVGADDFLTKPANDLQLMTRVKSLVRLKMLTDELRMRASTTRNIGIEELLKKRDVSEDAPFRALLVDDRQSSVGQIEKYLRGICTLDVVPDPQASLSEAAENSYECVLISTSLVGYDPLRLCSQLRTLDRTRFLPIILIAGQDEHSRLVRALELGVNDYVTRPVDRQELIARLRTQVKRKRYNEQLRSSVTQTIEMAVTDGLTGLHNRRYLDSHLASLATKARNRQKPLSVLITDIDKFKVINDTYGHDAGDDILREFAMRLRQSVRGFDLACRYGGEEFVIVMPDTELAVAQKVAERIREQIAGAPFRIEDGARQVDVTISIGVAALKAEPDIAENMMKRADIALYQAKNAGRNRVVAEAA